MLFNMPEILSAIATIFFMILLGWWLRVKRIPSEEYWLYADKLVYWLLFPALLFHKTSNIEISSELVQPIFSIAIAGMVLSVCLAWAGSRLLNFNPAASSAIFQGAARHNTFISLAIVERLFGDSGLLIATLVTALLVPASNIVIVFALVLILNKGQGQIIRKIGEDLIRNPIIIAIALGFSANSLGWHNIIIVHEVTGLLSNAALPVVLLCIGASMQFEDIHETFKALALSSVIKLIVFPAFTVLMIWLTHVPAELAIILCIYAATPTATSGFALTRQMGGDYKLMASLITQQTLISFISLPLTIYYIMRMFGLSL